MNLEGRVWRRSLPSVRSSQGRSGDPQRRTPRRHHRAGYAARPQTRQFPRDRRHRNPRQLPLQGLSRPGPVARTEEPVEPTTAIPSTSTSPPHQVATPTWRAPALHHQRSPPCLSPRSCSSPRRGPPFPLSIAGQPSTWTDGHVPEEGLYLPIRATLTMRVPWPSERRIDRSGVRRYRVAAVATTLRDAWSPPEEPVEPLRSEAQCVRIGERRWGGKRSGQLGLSFRSPRSAGRASIVRRGAWGLPSARRPGASRSSRRLAEFCPCSSSPPWRPPSRP